MFYLVSQHDSGVRTGVKSLSDVPVNGFQVIEVPDSVRIDETATPFDLAELNQQKYEGILASRPDFDSVFYDDLQDPSDLDTTSRAGGYHNGAVMLPPEDPSDGPGRIETDVITIPDPRQEFAVYWDVYSLDRTRSGRRFEKYFTREDPDLLEMFISHDGGSNFQKGLHGETIQFSPDAGTDIVIRLENETSSRYYVGALAFLY